MADLRAFGLSLTLLAAAAAADVPVAEDLVLAPAELRDCAVCHGVELQGNRAVDAPKLAGLPAWYVSRQMQAFRSGWRGTHSLDTTGMEMRPQAAALSPTEVTEAVAFVTSVPGRPVAPTVTGDVQRGARLYEPCAACHGARGEGNEALLSPPLAGQSDWYLATQLRYFRAGARGSAPGDSQGAVMQAAADVLGDDRAIVDVVAYIGTFEQPPQGESEMNSTAAARTSAAAAALALGLSGAAGADVTRYPLPGSDFPIAQAVEVTAGTTLVFHSGTTPRPANPDAERYSAEFWGDTEAQTMSVFSRIEESLAAKQLGLGDVVKMQVYLVAPPGSDAMDFDGFMNAYEKFFGTDEQPNLPARSTFQVAGLAAPGMLVEIELVLARP